MIMGKMDSTQSSKLKTTRKEHSINIYAEDGGLDLLNEVVDAYTADGPHPIAFYIEKLLIRQWI